MIKPLSKPIWNKGLCSFSIEHKELGLLNIKTQPRDFYSNVLTEIKDKKGNKIGTELFGFYDVSREIIGYDIKTKFEYRNRNLGLGRLLRLVSVMEMIKNEIKKITIFSKGTAVYFHAKHKFEPNIRTFRDRDALLETIVKDKSDLTKDLSIEAQNFAQNLPDKKNYEKVRKFNIKLNDLGNRYISRILSFSKEEYKNHPFDKGMDMILTKEKVFENRDFYNNLYKENGIDFVI